MRLSLLFGIQIVFDYLLIGENRGPELPDMLQALYQVAHKRALGSFCALSVWYLHERVCCKRLYLESAGWVQDHETHHDILVCGAIIELSNPI